MVKNDFMLMVSLIMIILPFAMYVAFYLLSKIITIAFKTNLYLKSLGTKSYKDWQLFMKSPLPHVYTGRNVIHKNSIRNVTRMLPPNNSNKKNVHKDKTA